MTISSNAACFDLLRRACPASSHLRSVIFCRSIPPRPIDTWHTSAQTRPRLTWIYGSERGRRPWLDRSATPPGQRIDSETVVLTSLGAEDILARIRGLQNENAAVKDTVGKLGTIVADINKARSRRTQLDAERKKIGEDQERIRQNLQSVGQGSDLGRQYIETLKKQEERLAEIARADHALEVDVAAKRLAAEQLTRQLSF